MRNPAALLILLAPLVTYAAEPAPPAPLNVPAVMAAPALSNNQRESLYEEQGMGYAKALYQDLSAATDDENRARKTEALNYRIRERGIGKLERHLAKAKEARVRKEILHRLAQLYEQQAEIITRRSDLKDKDAPYKLALRNSNKHLEQLRREFPDYAPDATIFGLAENHAKLKEDAAAERYYREVIAEYPRSPVVADSLLSLGNLYFERQAFLTAREFYGRILTASEEKLYPYAHYKMAWCYFNEKNEAAAVARLEQAILESRRISAANEKKLGVEEEALSDLVLFFAEYGKPDGARAYFERLVDRDKANELRFQLVKRLFDHGQHLLAKNTAKQLLDEHPQKEFVNKLYLILISVAERTKDRDFGLKTAEKLSQWVKEEKLATGDASRAESEEYMRLYSQKLHHEAETLKDKAIWDQARKSYEIYLATFPNEPDAPEVKFRYAVLLMNRKEQLKAYRAVTDALAKMDAKNPRFQDALKLRIQSIELASKDERKQIDDKDLLNAYDTYAKNFGADELAVEAQFKAATLAKNIETPEQAAARFRSIAEAHPQHRLANAAVGEALAVLVKAQKWEALGNESRTLSARTDLQPTLLAKDGDLTKRIAEARELSLVKITEGLEGEGKLAEAKAQYEKLLGESPSESLAIYSLVRLATLSEQKLAENRDAIGYYEKLRAKYPAAKEARAAALELARLYEKVDEPQEAVRRYLAFAAGGRGKLETQALTNSAVMLENLGERERAADAFARLADNLRGTKAPEKDVMAALDASCTNRLLSAREKPGKATLQRIADCARDLASATGSVQWQARAAWALDQMAEGLRGEERWGKLAGRSIKATPEPERAYVALAKLKLLEGKLAAFKTVRFTERNERPEANIGNKTHAMEELEKLSETVIKIGTAKQILSAKNVLKAAYVEFAETMDTAALPSKLSDAEGAELKKSFQTFDKEFRDRAAALETKDEPGRGLASVATAAPELPLGSLSGEERKLLERGQVPSERAAEIFAKKAYGLFEDGKFGEARYYSEKWKKQLEASPATPKYGAAELSQLQTLLAEKLPDVDPVSQGF